VFDAARACHFDENTQPEHFSVLLVGRATHLFSSRLSCLGLGGVKESFNIHEMNALEECLRTIDYLMDLTIRLIWFCELTMLLLTRWLRALKGQRSRQL
jgi:hypothetical protein